MSMKNYIIEKDAILDVVWDSDPNTFQSDITLLPLYEEEAKYEIQNLDIFEQEKRELTELYGERSEDQPDGDEYYSSFYERRKKNIAVICMDSHDFRLWIAHNELEGLGGSRKFLTEHATYHCICNRRDLRALPIDEVVETEFAHQNPEYQVLMNLAKQNLKI